ncbi:MAG TPA: ATPase, T2SS/T4P/T4SS family [Arthrobacter sp.]
MLNARIGGRLTSKGVLSLEEYLAFEAIAVEENRGVLRVLLDRKAIDDEQANDALAHNNGWVYRPLASVGSLPAELIDLIDPSTGREMMVLPIEINEGTLVVATANPGDLNARAKLQGKTGHKVNFVYTPLASLAQAVNYYYSMDIEMEKKGVLASEAIALETRRAKVNATNNGDEGEVVDLLNSIIEGGISARSSDIHLEPGEAGLDVRYEIDGVEHRQRGHSRELAERMAALIKTRAGLASSTLYNQDGAIRHFYESQNRNYDLRVAILPAVWGESITLRIASDHVRPLSEVNFSPGTGEKWRSAYSQPNGAIICVGPMGSGKTQLLMGTIKELQKTGRKIISLEDPVEVRLPSGMTQVSLRPGMSWEDTVPTVLRSAGKILMFGEINKDHIAQETMKAAQTGHLILSTLHTNDAPSSLIRLAEMGVQKSIMADTLRAVCAQRLPRTLCNSCKVPTLPDRENVLDFKLSSEDLNAVDPITGKSVWYGPGTGKCAECKNLRYSGRLPIHELMIFTRNIREMILEGEPQSRIVRAARDEGMNTLQEDGILKVRAGLTSLHELRRHIVID